MAKAKNICFTALFSAASVASFVLGDNAYRKFIRANRAWDPDSEEGRRSDETLHLKAIDNTSLYATLFLPENKQDTHDYVILLRDYQQSIKDMGPLLSHYNKGGMGVLVPDARGCGNSTGNYLGYGYDDRLDLLSWIHKIIKRDAKANIALHGFGVGAATALLAGAEHLPPCVYALIADSCYTNLSAYLERRMRFVQKSGIPSKLRLLLLRGMTLARAGYDIKEVSPEKAVEKMNVPTLFLHGDEDKEIPVDMSRTLYHRARCARQIGIFMGAGHLEGLKEQEESYFSRIDAFLSARHPDRL